MLRLIDTFESIAFEVVADPVHHLNNIVVTNDGFQNMEFISQLVCSAHAEDVLAHSSSLVWIYVLHKCVGE